MAKIIQLVNALFISIILLYRWLISPLLPPRCRFYPSCSHYALTALKTHHLFRAFSLILLRISRCHPWHPGGIDEVPKPNQTVNKVNYEVT